MADRALHALQRAFPTFRADTAFVYYGMAGPELLRLADVMRDAVRILEIGMAKGTSTVALLANPHAHVTSIDPFQTSDVQRAGIEAVRAAGFADRHTLIEQPDYVALPALLASGDRFDGIFIDGYHSTDYAMLDAFYADLLLDVGGILAFHDTDAPAVYFVAQFIDALKPYERLSPRLMPYDALRWWRRLRFPAEHRARQQGWRSLAAYRKRGNALAPQFHP